MRQVSRVAREIADALSLAIRHTNNGGAEGITIATSNLQRWLLMLSPSKKKRRPRDTVRAARRTTVRELDKLCRAIVFARDGNRCKKCGKSNGLLDWAHILSRRHPKTRHHLMNSMVLCRKHHMEWHDRPIEATTWFVGEFGPLAYVKLKALATGAGRANNELTRLYLESEASKLGVKLET